MFSSASFRSTHNLDLVLALCRVIAEPPSRVAPPRASRRCHALEHRHRTRCLLRAIPSEPRARGTRHRSVSHRKECPIVADRPRSPSESATSTKSSSALPCALVTTRFPSMPLLQPLPGRVGEEGERLPCLNLRPKGPRGLGRHGWAGLWPSRLSPFQ
jgi:hypothetical protein